MINYFRMKKAEWKIKATFFGAIASIIDNQKEVLSLLQKMYIALKDIPVEDLQKEIVAKLAEIIHNENKDKTE
jgi:GTP1/Obg family GTP-binding protein